MEKDYVQCTRTLPRPSRLPRKREAAQKCEIRGSSKNCNFSNISMN